jgi:hypothetical protein
MTFANPSRRRRTVSFVAAIIVLALAIPFAAQAQTSAPVAAVATTLSAVERAELLKQTKAAQEAIDRHDFDAMMKLVAPAVYKLIDKPRFEQQARAAMAQLQALGFKYVTTEFGEPSTPYRVGQDIVCFVPRISLIELQGKRIRSHAYWVAVRPADGAEWKFIDGAAFQVNRASLWVLFPELPKDVRLPEWKQEVVSQ